LLAILQAILREYLAFSDWGIEAWLEDSNGLPIALSKEANISCPRGCVCYPKTSKSVRHLEKLSRAILFYKVYAPRWRTIAKCDPRAALLEGDDGVGICVFDPDCINLNLKVIEVIDDAEREEPPWIIFEFKFWEVLKMTH